MTLAPPKKFLCCFIGLLVYDLIYTAFYNNAQNCGINAWTVVEKNV